MAASSVDSLNSFAEIQLIWSVWYHILCFSAKFTIFMGIWGGICR